MQNLKQNSPPSNAINITPTALKSCNMAELTIKTTVQPVNESNMSKLLASCCDCV